MKICYNDCKIMERHKGFTLIEILLVVGITAILGTTLFLFSYGIKVQKDLDGAVNSVAAVVRDAQQKSITQQDMKKWGVHLERNSIQIYDLFRDVHLAANILAQYSLPPSLEFDGSNWGGSSKEIIFTQVDGLPTSGENVIIIRIINEPNSSRQVTISANGTVSY